MTPIAIGLVLLSAVFHALWNVVAKQARGGPVFVWLFGVMEIVIYLPFVVYLIAAEQPTIDFVGLFFMVGSAALHLAYFVLLSKGYQVGDLSIVYPLARAIGPLIATVAAIFLLAERPTMLALTGGLLVSFGVFGLTGDPRKLRARGALPGIRFAGLTGVAIAAYTVWDSYAVKQLLIAPLIFQWHLGAFRALFLTPHALKHWDEVQEAWQRDRWRAAFVAVFSSLAYILILIALTVSPVSYVAPMRVVSTLIGVIIGVGLLKEGDSTRRVMAAVVMVVGVFALSVG